MKKRLLFFCIALLSINACISPQKRQLEQAEHLLDTQPDSSLRIVQSIEPTSLRTKKDRAYYALVLNRALYKNYIDIADDSLINLSVAYYSPNNNTREKMLSLFHQGLVRKNAQHYSSAIVSFEMAENIADNRKDNHMLGLINRYKSDIFNGTNNYTEAITYGKRALSAFEDNRDSMFISYEKYAIAISLYNSLQFDESLAILSDILEQDIPLNLRTLCILCSARNLAGKETAVNEAISLFRQTPKQFFQTQDYGIYASTLFNAGQTDSAYFWLNKGYELANNREEKALLKYYHSSIAYKSGDYKLAYQLEDQALHTQDSLTRIRLQQSLSNAQRDYYQSESKHQELVVKRQREGIVYASIIICLLFTVFFLFIRQEKKRREILIKEKMAQLSLLQEKALHNNAYLIGTLAKEKMVRLYNLSDDYFMEENQEKKRIAFLQFKQALRSIRNDPSFFVSLEVDLNKYCNNIMIKLREQVPSIQGDKLKLCILLFSGLPNEWIQILGEKNSGGSIKTARSRLRHTIKDACAEDENLFLNMLEAKKQPRDKTKR